VYGDISELLRRGAPQGPVIPRPGDHVVNLPAPAEHKKSPKDSAPAIGTDAFEAARAEAVSDSPEDEGRRAERESDAAILKIKSNLDRLQELHSKLHAVLAEELGSTSKKKWTHRGRGVIMHRMRYLSDVLWTLAVILAFGILLTMKVHLSHVEDDEAPGPVVEVVPGAEP